MKSILVAIRFKNLNFSHEFGEHNTLQVKMSNNFISNYNHNSQDLYTWLKQEFLKKEIFTSGAELILCRENLKFPLKANTANTLLINLPTRSFKCADIVKVGKQSTTYVDPLITLF